jgi:predicted DNA-binding protein (MmcQ/YjbR family)
MIGSHAAPACRVTVTKSLTPKIDATPGAAKTASAKGLPAASAALEADSVPSSVVSSPKRSAFGLGDGDGVATAMPGTLPVPAVEVDQVAASIGIARNVAGQREVERVDNMARLEQIVAKLPEAQRVDIEAWGGEPTFRVNGKNFIFTDERATGLSVKLPKPEAEAVVATDKDAEPTGYGLGRHGWVSVQIGAKPSAARWRQIEEWVRTSYTMVAPKKLARLVLDEDVR